ncbi:hypothetical protein [Cupriavidus neocaledonicus]|uniref:Uncharacterized protein n=1 Tax=Cupriavidus neocaledonicus TaxID=1040979 RepID=A0A375H5Z7_9BURK|nr:hypothetical protein [Cupriavidus neocaledonicus]SPD46665.1 conserved protein of unknown function [Cupriavidus neocaledonicus]
MRPKPHSRRNPGGTKPGKSQRRNYAANLWIFFSNKNQQLHRIEGDLPFMHCVLMEGDPNIVRYAPPIVREPGESASTVPPIAFSSAQSSHGPQTWFCYRWEEAASSEAWNAALQELHKQAEDRGAVCHIVLGRDLERQKVLFDNWLVLSRAMTAARSFPRQREALALAELLSRTSSFELTVGMHQPECDPAIMLALIARQLQLGKLTADLGTQLLSAATIVHGRSA